jgi:hypothetical protein
VNASIFTVRPHGKGIQEAESVEPCYGGMWVKNRRVMKSRHMPEEE